MDITKFKELLPEESFGELEQYVSDLQGQRDQARNESINGRRSMKEELEQLRGLKSQMMEKLGVEDLEELENLPDAKGMAEAQRQYEVKLKRLQRENETLQEQASTLDKRYKTSKEKIAISEAMAGHDFIAQDLVEAHLRQSLVWEDEDLLAKGDDGNIMTLKDAVAGLAKSRPELLKAAGTGGAGVRSNQARGEGGVKEMTRQEFQALPPEDRMEASKSGVRLT